MITGLRTRFSGRELRRHLQTQIRELTAVVKPLHEAEEAKTPVTKAVAIAHQVNYAETKVTGRPPISSLAQAMGGEESFKQAANGGLVAEAVGVDPAKVRAAHQFHERCRQELETAKYWLDNIDADEEYLLSLEEMAALGYEVPGSEEAEEVPPAYPAYEPPDQYMGRVWPAGIPVAMPLDDIRTRLIKLQYAEDLSPEFRAAVTVQLEALGVETIFTHDDADAEEVVEPSGD